MKYLKLKIESGRSTLRVSEQATVYCVHVCMSIYGGFPSKRDPQNGWFVMENPNLKWMIWGYPYLHTCSNNHHLPMSYLYPVL